MKKTYPRKVKQTWPKRVSFGRETVTIYRRRTPNGAWGYMLSDYSGGVRRFRSYATEEEAVEAATILARRLAERQVVAASLTNEEAATYAAAVQVLQPLRVPLLPAVDVIAEGVKLTGSLSGIMEACRQYAASRALQSKSVAEAVEELLAVQRNRGVSDRYYYDLSYRLGRFTEAVVMDMRDVKTPHVQAFLDGLQLSAQSYVNYRRALNLLFEFGKRRHWCADNPVNATERVKVRDPRTEIFTPEEMRRLLAVAEPDILPSLVLGAFAGLRSAEIERLRWSDTDLKRRIITIDNRVAKTAARRVVPVTDNLAAWLGPFSNATGRVWPHSVILHYRRKRETAAATAVDGREPVVWKPNALRHSYASYRYAILMDAGRVAAELGNSPNIVHRFYRELVSAEAAREWFSIMPAQTAVNVVPMASTR